MKLLFKEVRSHGRGDPADESESWTSNTTFVLVDSSDRDEYEERCASEYGYQDYSYRFNRVLLCELQDEEVEELKNVLNSELKEVFVSTLGFEKPKLKRGEKFILVLDTPGGIKKVMPDDPAWAGFCVTYGVNEGGKNRVVLE